MSNIVDWLRVVADNYGMGRCEEALEEIERLRAENERLREASKKADFDYEKFAELIVDECLFFVDDETKGNWDVRVEIFNDIKKHFGVK